MKLIWKAAIQVYSQVRAIGPRASRACLLNVEVAQSAFGRDGHDASENRIRLFRDRRHLRTLTTLLPMPDAPKVLMTYAFSERDGSTHIEIRVAKPKPKDKAFLEHVRPQFHKNITNEIATLRRMLEGPQDVAGAIEEPALPVSGERFLTQPVDPG